MNRLSTEKRANILHHLVRNCGVRDTARLTDTAFNSVLRLGFELGEACRRWQHRHVRNLRFPILECDEIWGFIHCKEGTIPLEQRGNGVIGDSYLWSAICPKTKFMPAWHVGTRDFTDALIFMTDLASRVDGNVQLNTDAWGNYRPAIMEAFGDRASHGVISKAYRASKEKTRPDREEAKFSPPKLKAKPKRYASMGNIAVDSVSTSLMERGNLTIRSHNKRMNRLTNAHSKKFENHRAALALFFQFYNYARIHSSLRVTPAMELAVSDHVWELSEIVALMN